MLIAWEYDFNKWKERFIEYLEINGIKPSTAKDYGRRIEKILEEVGRSYSVNAADIKGKKRTQNIAEARKMSMYIVRQVCEMSMEDIGKEFGGRDHSTVVYTIKEVEKKMEKDSFYRSNIEDIIKNVKSL